MRRFLSLFMVLMLTGILAFAQTRVVTGKVTDEQGNGVPFATIKVKGTSRGTSADQTGAYSLKVNQGEVLVISSQGRASKEVTVGTTSVVNIALAAGTQSTLTEVVVSGGYNTKRTARSSVTNAQVVNNQQLTVIRPTNLNNALAGKVAGIQVQSQSSAALGRDANIRLHGEGGFGSSTVIYVVDGTILTSGVDINPDDVEDLTVLNGPTGASIYGPQAANGAIIITTKKAKKGQKGLGIELNTGLQFDKVYNLPSYQNSYAGGGVGDLILFSYKPGMPTEWQSLDGKYYHDYTDDASWGPRMVGQEYIPWYAWYPGTQYTGKTASLTAQPDNAKDFFNTGVTANNNISLSKAGDGYSTRISYTNLDVKGLIPNSFLRKNILASNFSIDLGTHFTVGANINYVTQKQQSENDDEYSNQSTGTFNSWFHRDLDMNIMKEFADYRTPLTATGGGILPSWNHSNPGSFNATAPDDFYKGNYWYNFYTYFNNISNIQNRNRIYGDVNVTYKITNDFKLRGAFRTNRTTTTSEDKINYALENSATQSGVKAYYGTGLFDFRDDRMELTGSYTHKIKDLNIDLLGGGEIVKRTTNNLTANTRNGLYIPDFFSLNNSKDPITQTNTRIKDNRRAIFGRIALNFRNYLFGEVTLRNDWFSALVPADYKTNTDYKNSVFVKSFGLSFVFSDLTKNATPWLSYGKIRGSLGETPQSIDPYVNALNYAVGADQWNGNFVMGVPNTIPSPTLTGSIQKVAEAGIDLRFVKNRIGLSVTYFNRITNNSPITVQVNGTSGFTNEVINAGKIISNYMDVQLNLKPFAGRNFAWDLNMNMSKNFKNVIDSIAPNISQINITGGNGANFTGITTPRVVHTAHKQWGMLTGGGKTYINGQPVLDANGHFVKTEDVQFGSVLPDFTGGLQNTFTYKGFTLNVNVDFQKGGKFFSLSDMWGSFSGLTLRTAVLNDRGLPIRDPVADGGGVHVSGVDATGKAVSMYVEAQDYFHSMVNNNVFDEFIYDLTFVKLRELSLGYNIPVKNFGISKWLQSANFSIVARNPLLIYAKTRDFDPSEIKNIYGENGQYPGSKSIGFNLKLGF